MTTNRKLPTLITSAVLTLCSTALAQQNAHLLKLHEPRPGQSVVVHTVSDSPNAAMTITRGAAVQKGRTSINRDRKFVRSIRGTGATTQLVYKVLSDQIVTSIVLGAEKDTKTTTGALVGHTALGFRDSIGRWRLFLESGTSRNKQAAELAELEAYENRRWYPPRPVTIGQTWPIDPAFIRHLTERDLGKGSVEASMTFKSIETIGDKPTAVLTFQIETVGSSIDAAAGKEAGALASIKGTLFVDLDTMLDKRLVMNGTLTTIARQHGSSTEIVLPVNYTVTKTVR